MTLTPAARWGFFVALIQQCIVENLLRFSFGNAKLPATTAIFDIPAGYTCPGAHLCQSRFDRGIGKIIDGPNTVFRCFSATQESRPNINKKRWHNLDLMKQAGSLPQLLIDSLNYRLERKTTHVRWHVSGDFFSYQYCRAVLLAAQATPDLTHYFYTKSLHFWQDVLLPDNVFLTASRGGKYDHLIDQGYFPRNATVVYTEGEAAEKGLPIDHDDSHCYTGDPHAFGLLVHGTQPKGSIAGAAIQLRKKQGKFVGYSKQSAAKNS